MKAAIKVCLNFKLREGHSKGEGKRQRLCCLRSDTKIAHADLLQACMEWNVTKTRGLALVSFAT